MRKQNFVFIIIVCLLFTFATSTTAEGEPIQIIVNGELLELDTAPFFENGRTLVPLRGVFEALNSNVNWDGFTKTITAVKGDSTIRMQIGHSSAIKNDTEIKLDAPAQIVNNRTYVPLRFAVESLGASVTWDKDNNRILILFVEDENSLSSEKLSINEVAQNEKSMLLLKVYDRYNTLIGTGSGFIISEDGRVITNYHVIDQGFRVEAITSDNKLYKVQGVLNYNVEQDLAIISLDKAHSLPYVRLGDSDKLTVGDEVVAIGSPLALQNTVSNGIISGKRDFDTNTYIQTSAPISAGSSGGALFNMYGEVIGVTVGSFGGQNLNLAIPINQFKPLLEQKKMMTLEEMISIVYPKMTYQEFIEYLNDDYSVFQTKDYRIEINHVRIEEDDEDSNLMYISLIVDKENLNNLFNAISYGRHKEDIEAWMYAIAQETDLRFADKKYVVVLSFFGSFKEYPDNFLENEISYDEENSEYDVFSPIIYVDNYDDFIDLFWDYDI